jgi:hypothetical protein
MWLLWRVVFDYAEPAVAPSPAEGAAPPGPCRLAARPSVGDRREEPGARRLLTGREEKRLGARVQDDLAGAGLDRAELLHVEARARLVAREDLEDAAVEGDDLAGAETELEHAHILARRARRLSAGSVADIRQS